jgi:hypothetical protein
VKFFLLCITLSLLLSTYAADRLLEKTRFKDISIDGEEYWIFDDQKEGTPYSRDSVIWSYKRAPKTAQKCAKIAYKKLRGWLEDESSNVAQALSAYSKAGYPSGIYFWVNDYTKAKRKADRPRSHSVWIWKDRYLKFESVLMPDGKCKTPSEEHILNFVNKKLAEKSLSPINYDHTNLRKEEGTFIQDSPREINQVQIRSEGNPRNNQEATTVGR